MVPNSKLKYYKFNSKIRGFKIDSTTASSSPLLQDQMEIEGQDGSKTSLKPGSSTVFGRGSFFSREDKTVSRQHMLLQLQDKSNNPSEPSKVVFQVIGKNPVWIRNKEEDTIKVVRKGDKGEVTAGDWFCVSTENPVWFCFKEKETNGEEQIESLESFDASKIDPVKEFGFLVIGHEFDSYLKQRMRDVNKWDWFLEEPGQDSDNDENSECEKKRGGRGKRKKGRPHDADDDDWTGGSEDDKEVVGKIGKFDERPKYGTRSNDKNKLSGNSDSTKSSKGRKSMHVNVDDNEDDDTLGGFIVNDEEDGEGQETDEEEEFIDEEDEE